MKTADMAEYKQGHNYDNPKGFRAARLSVCVSGFPKVHDLLPMTAPNCASNMRVLDELLGKAKVWHSRKHVRPRPRIRRSYRKNDMFDPPSVIGTISVSKIDHVRHLSVTRFEFRHCDNKLSDLQADKIPHTVNGTWTRKSGPSVRTPPLTEASEVACIRFHIPNTEL